VKAYDKQTSQESVIQDGWVQRYNNWFFYLNGNKQTGWMHVPVSNGSSTLGWFYLGTDGRMRTNWALVRVSNSDDTLDWFYFGTNGQMRTSYWAKAPYPNSDGTYDWFYFGLDGRINVDWQDEQDYNPELWWLLWRTRRR